MFSQADQNRSETVVKRQLHRDPDEISRLNKCSEFNEFHKINTIISIQVCSVIGWVLAPTPSRVSNRANKSKSKHMARRASANL